MDEAGRREPLYRGQETITQREAATVVTRTGNGIDAPKAALLAINHPGNPKPGSSPLVSADHGSWDSGKLYWGV